MIEPMAMSLECCRTLAVVSAAGMDTTAVQHGFTWHGKAPISAENKAGLQGDLWSDAKKILPPPSSRAPGMACKYPAHLPTMSKACTLSGGGGRWPHSAPIRSSSTAGSNSWTLCGGLVTSLPAAAPFFRLPSSKLLPTTGPCTLNEVITRGQHPSRWPNQCSRISRHHLA